MLVGFSECLQMRWGCLCPNWSHAGSKCSTSTETAYARRGRAAVVEASTSPGHVKPFAKHFALGAQHSPNKCLRFALCFKTSFQHVLRNLLCEACYTSLVTSTVTARRKRRPSTYVDEECQRNGDNIFLSDGWQRCSQTVATLFTIFL